MNTQQQQSIVFGKSARFTVLADNCIRMEYSKSGDFLDASTLSVAQRKIQSTEFSIKEDGNHLKIETSELLLSYTATSQGFSSETLEIRYQNGADSRVWKYGDADDQNLPGTLRTLDCMDGDRVVSSNGTYVCPWDKDVMELTQETPDVIPGYLSKSGYTVFDDSSTPPLIKSSPQDPAWVTAPRGAEVQDLYFSAYGSDYYRGLQTMARYLGKQPIPPRFAFGLWFSRYWEFTDKELENIVETHDDYNIPLDVLVIDMDWHKLGWTGYSWDPTFFPDPGDTLAYLQDNGIKITMNLHPADGVAQHEDQYEAMCEEMGVDASSGDTVPFDCTSPRYMDAYFRLLHHPFEDQGVRFWWMDWQQGKSTAIKGLDALPWLNYLHWQDLATRFPKRRPMIFSRFGGPGAGRYPIGFSGDTHISWKSLAYQPYFTASGANVGFGYWSHDIGGHFFSDETDPELYTRWVQFGAYSPVLRLHESKSVEDHRFFWNYKRPFCDVLIATARKRYQMLPYITSELYTCWRDDSSLCMPMYYEYPEVEDAYLAKDQYFFGRQMVIAPITQAADLQTGLARKRIWIPEGEWIDLSLGLKHQGPKWIEESYTLQEVPVFVKPGAIWVEQAHKLRAGTGSFDDLEIVVVGPDASTYCWNEDDGDSTGYQQNEIATIEITQSSEACARCITIQQTGTSTYAGVKATRKACLRLPFSAVPQRVTIDGASVDFSKRANGPSWRYAGDRLELVVELGTIDLQAGCTVEIISEDSDFKAKTERYVYRQSRLQHAWSIAQAGAFKSLTPLQRSLPWLAQTGRRLTHFPNQLNEEMSTFSDKWERLPDEHAVFCDLLEIAQKRVTPEVLKNRQAIDVLRATK
ncbi:glycoside hydrolase family 31 protein [Coraliomargarita sp. SDUM461003]|uniref:Glycoside hydrolase family 31 protein n=1 Tax=Thalassobacterium maritimum TaxID=3041265 RepID=A0ABU1AQ74_9BACT|nr:TIM-barrel domain-containing protein [Coraliomargarita sp. SDUM461003]MDQ8206321.1 glycoside hydrolase family 31 protein [Coraliomargarita sp. SDUM461003]